MAPAVADTNSNAAYGLYADIDGGSGDDLLSATLGAAIGGTTHVDMDGSSGDDDLIFAATGDIAADAKTRVELCGDSGDDNITGTFSGQILGTLKYSADGGPGDDVLVSNLTAAIGSTGTLVAKSCAGSGDDEVTLNVFDLSGNGGGTSLLAELHAKIFASAADTLVNTLNVDVILGNGNGDCNCDGGGRDHGGGNGNGLGRALNFLDNIVDRVFGRFGYDD
jgi:hypothetical protein